MACDQSKHKLRRGVHTRRVNNPNINRCYPSKHKHLYNIGTMLDKRRRRWDDVVQMLYKCFVFTAVFLTTSHATFLSFLRMFSCY